MQGYIARKGDEECQRGDLIVRKSVLQTGKAAQMIALSLIHESTSFSINSLLPEGWNILEKITVDPPYESQMDSTKKLILWANVQHPEEVGRSILQMRGSFISLLHEIGHAHDDEATATEQRNDELIEQEAQIGLTQLKDVAGFLDEYREKVFMPERRAWQWALQHYRMLMQMGLDCEPELPSILMKEFVDHALYQYTLDTRSNEQVLDLHGNLLKQS